MNPSKVQSSEKHEGFSDMWWLDSGASSHITSDIKDFVEYHDFSKSHYTQTANSKAPIVGHGTALISYCGNVVHLLPTIYMPTCHVKLISLGTLLKNECLSGRSSKNLFMIYNKCSKKDLITFHSHGENTMYWVCTPTVWSTNNATSTMSTVDYELLHCHMGHPSKDVLRAGQKHIKDFPDVYISSNKPVCPGCQLGKQPNCPFTHDEICDKTIWTSTLRFKVIPSGIIPQVQICYHFLWWLYFYGLGTRNTLKRPSLTGSQSFP